MGLLVLVKQVWRPQLLGNFEINFKLSSLKILFRALNRKYARVSMGGESDSPFLKGHRKTYIGAYPGKVIQALKDCQTENCVILLDEVKIQKYY